MQLKLRVGVGDTLTINVDPTDTFQDLSDRLYSLGGVKVDLSQLKSNDKPFTMSTNVVSYFMPKEKGDEAEETNDIPKRHCRLCSETISSEAIYLFQDNNENSDKITLVEKVNSSLPILVSVHDHLPKQICENCHGRVNKSFDFMQKVVEAQETLQEVYCCTPKDRPVTNYKEEAGCPLCTMGHFKHVDHKLKVVGRKNAVHEKPAKKEMVYSTPKTTVTSRKETVSQPYIKQEPIEAEYYGDDIVTGYWESGQDNDTYSIKRAKKRIKVEDDADWTIDEEYVPVSRRGRPRGTKNKPRIQIPVIEKTCVICNWVGADIDMLAHTINQHCQPDMDYFPCPLCKAHQPNEMILETHIDKHNARK